MLNKYLLTASPNLLRRDYNQTKIFANLTSTCYSPADQILVWGTIGLLDSVSSSICPSVMLFCLAHISYII